MIINATAYLQYNRGESISSGWEGLWLHVKFKEKGNLLKTKLSKRLTSTYNVECAHDCEPENRIDSYEDYYRIVNETIDDIELLRKVAICLIEKHFEENSQENDKDKSKEDAIRKVNKSPKIEITVEIK